MAGSDWRSRLREAAYISPGGTRKTFKFGDVSRSYELRGTAFGFPGVDGEYVQRKGVGSRKYPLRCLFSGPNYDIEATQFEDILLAPGVGKLHHPMYGTFDVVPFGEVTRRDDLKTAANQAIVDVVFWTTLRDIYPRALVNRENEIESALHRYSSAAAAQFERLTDLSKTVQKEAAKATIRDFIKSVGGVFDQLSDTVWSVRDTFQDIEDTINLGLDVLVGKPLVLASQIANLLAAPSRAIDGIISRLDGYADFAEEIFGSPAANPADELDAVAAAVSGRYGLTDRGKRVANDFHIADLFASQAVAGAVLSTLQSTTEEQSSAVGASVASGRSAATPGSDPRVARTFLTKTAALAAADGLLELSDSYTAWRDAGFAALQDIDKTGVYQADPGEAAAELKASVLLAAGHLVSVSFTAMPEKAIVLDRACTPIDLAAKLYGHVDPRSDFDPVLFLVETNSLSGRARLEIPRGTKIKYYDKAA